MKCFSLASFYLLFGQRRVCGEKKERLVGHPEHFNTACGGVGPYLSLGGTDSMRLSRVSHNTMSEDRPRTVTYSPYAGGEREVLGGFAALQEPFFA